MSFRHLGRLAAGLLLSVTLAGSANAAVRYTFDFFNLEPYLVGFGAFDDFSLTLEVPDYITVTGMNPLGGDPLPTSLGYSVWNAGMNRFGEFAFSETGGSMSDSGATFSNTLFDFLPSTASTNYIRAPGVFAGLVFGNSPKGAFRGNAQLTVTDTLAVPEPGTWAVMILGFGVVGLMLRRRPFPLALAA